MSEQSVDNRKSVPSNPKWEGICRVICYDKNEVEAQNKLINYNRKDDRLWFGKLVMWAMSHDHLVEIVPLDVS